MIKNKFYQIYDYVFPCGTNIVIAPNARKAKAMSVGVDCIAHSYFTHIKVQAIKDGDWFYIGEIGSKTVHVGGKGFVYTDEDTQIDWNWDIFFNELKRQERYIERDDE